MVLGADTKKIRTKDSVKLIEYAFSAYTYINAKEKIEEAFSNWLETKANTIQYQKAKNQVIEYELKGEETIWVPVLKGKQKDVAITIEEEQRKRSTIRKRA